MSLLQTSRVFDYRPFGGDKALTHIRVIRIKPGCGEPIQCVMKHMERPTSRSESSYSCLSYTWDPKEPGRPIYIEGEDINEGTKNVGKNLGDFLGAARDAKVTGWLWIDALCINQKDVPEREQQVRQMGQTYQKAKEVFVWLGLIDEPVVHALENMVGVEENDPSAHWEVWLGHLSTILSVQYWTRLWIAQEFVLPDDPVLFFQNFQTSSHRLAVSMTPFMSDDKLTKLPGWKYFWWRLVRYEAVADRSNPPSVRGINKSVSLASLIRRFADSGCGDKRDRVYGLLSFADDGDSKLVDYTASEGAVFRNTMALMKRHKRALDELLLIGEALIESLELWQATRPSSSSLEINFDGSGDVTLPVWDCTILETYDERPGAEGAREKIETTCMYVGVRDGPDVHVFEYSIEKPKERPIVKYSRAYEYLRGRPPASFVPGFANDVLYFWLRNVPSEALHYFYNRGDSRPLWNWPPREFDISGLRTDESTEHTDRDILPALRIVESDRSTTSLPWEGYATPRVAMPFLANFNWDRLINESEEYKYDASAPPSGQHPRSTTLRMDVKKYLEVHGKKE